MAINRLGQVTLSEADMDVVVKVFDNRENTQAFISLLNRVRTHYQRQQQQIMEQHLLSDDPVQRAMALQTKGTVSFLTDLSDFISTVNK